MSRAIFAIALAAAALAAQAQPRMIEMDVLELNERPAHAVQRMDEAMRRAAALRAGPREGPGAQPFIPEESLGSRGLTALGAIVQETGGPGSDRGHDKDDNEGHDKEHDKDLDKDDGHDDDKDDGGEGDDDDD